MYKTDNCAYDGCPRRLDLNRIWNYYICFASRENCLKCIYIELKINMCESLNKKKYKFLVRIC